MNQILITLRAELLFLVGFGLSRIIVALNYSASIMNYFPLLSVLFAQTVIE